MFANERRNKILELLNRRSSVTVAELTALFQVSLETIRRDLEYLEQQGALKRVHGGALSMNRMQNYTGLSVRSTEHQTEKRQIARAALSHIHEGERIALDAGSTTNELAHLLCDSFQELTIVTASLPIFEILSEKPGFQVILTGGFYLPGEKAFYGHLALDTIRQLHVSVFFHAPSALSLSFGLSEHIRELAEIQRALIASADRVIVLADSSKFETCAALKVCDLSRRFLYLTDSGLSEEIRTAWQKASFDISSPPGP